MKVMFLLEYYPPDIDVSAIRLSEIVKTFSKNGVDNRVVVFNPMYKKGYIKNESNVSDNVKIVRYGRKIIPRVFHIIYSINPFTLLCWIIIANIECYRYKPDVIVSSVPTLQPTITAYITSLINKKSHCLDMRDNWLNNNMERFFIGTLPWYAKGVSTLLYRVNYYLFIQSCKNAKLISTVYDNMTQDIHKITNKDKNIISIPNGINTEELTNIKKIADKKTILNKFSLPYGNNEEYIVFTGMIGGYYKPELLLKYIKILNDAGNNICYIIIGDGDSVNLIRQQYQELGLDNKVFLLGKREHKEVLELLLISDIAFYALDENFPNPEHLLGVKVLEYIACKLPILAVANSNSIVYRLIEEKRIGITLKWNETSEIDGSIIKLINDNSYKSNIEIYYSDFINKYSREINNDILVREFLKLKLPPISTDK